MGKISQYDAQKAAKTIVEPIREKKTEAKNLLSEYITELWKDTIPAPVMKLYKTHSEYISTVSSVQVTGQGIDDNESVSLIGQWPSPSGGGWYTQFPLTNPQAKEAVKLIDEIEKLDKKYEDTMKEIEQTILNLSTHKRVLEQFPEAYGALPGVNTNTQLTVQLQPVRDKVKCLISDDKEKKCIDKI